jgi:hypothetical protein
MMAMELLMLTYPLLLKAMDSNHLSMVNSLQPILQLQVTDSNLQLQDMDSSLQFQAMDSSLQLQGTDNNLLPHMVNSLQLPMANSLLNMANDKKIPQIIIKKIIYDSFPK